MVRSNLIRSKALLASTAAAHQMTGACASNARRIALFA